eukprot:CAMPEP_0175191606 /NCGR_PEP_ID=MMETSP0093-20121207/5029_1 /TAXON_ID=311494 /ORGANISM="Alexandrium monilatum, Strain CCMP3105" /LENGTH=76 /DNA_ID=CAMNT_0016484435 /DNA_START=261 /DNA_END=491 /DNA_ORIENTATION=+
MTRYSLGKICAAHAALALGLQRAWRLARLPSSPPPRACCHQPVPLCQPHPGPRRRTTASPPQPSAGGPRTGASSTR